MASDLVGFDNFTLKGGPVARAIAALRVARHHMRLAVADTASWRLEAVLSDIENDLDGHISRIEDALADDAADAEADGEARVLRQAELPLRVA